MDKRCLTYLSLSVAWLSLAACSGDSTPPGATPGAGGAQGVSESGTGAATGPVAGTSGGTAATTTGAPGSTGTAGTAAATAGGRAGSQPMAAGSTAGTAAGGAGTSGDTAGETAATAGTSGDTAGTPATEPPRETKPRRAVSADFLHKTLSIVDVDKLKEGAKREDALLGTVDLSMYTPGPLAVAVTPDGKTAVVSISGGWLGLVGSNVPAGDGTMVFVDLETKTVLGELNTGRVPMGIAITKDGKHAFVGMMSETYLAYIDIEKRTFERISSGNSWNEEVAIDDTGMIGMLTTGTGGDAMGFSISDPKTHGQTRGQSGDAGGVAFFPGTLFAFVVQAPTALTGNLGGYNVIDVTNPMSPMVTDTNRVMNDARISYPVTSVANRKSIVYPSTNEGQLNLLEMALENGKAKQVQSLNAGPASTLAYGLSASPEGLVLAAVGTDHIVVVADLATGKAFSVPWGITETGPLDIKYIPSN